MKKIRLVVISLIAIGVLVIIYQQHQLIQDYRSLLYGELTKLNVPVIDLIEFHEDAEGYSEEEIDTQLDHLYARFSDFANFTGGGLHVEADIREEYYGTYFDTKSAYGNLIRLYADASTPGEREQAIAELKKTFEHYNEFLETAKADLDIPI